MFFGRWVWLLAYELVATYMWIWCNGNMTAFPWCSLKVKLLMNELNIDENYLKVVKAALDKSKEKGVHVIALELPKGKIITGKQTELLSPASSLIINAVKELSKIPDDINLLSPSILEPILNLIGKIIWI